MELIEWKEEYSVSVPQFDEQPAGGAEPGVLRRLYCHRGAFAGSTAIHRTDERRASRPARRPGSVMPLSDLRLRHDAHIG